MNVFSFSMSFGSISQLLSGYPPLLRAIFSCSARSSYFLHKSNAILYLHWSVTYFLFAIGNLLFFCGDVLNASEEYFPHALLAFSSVSASVLSISCQGVLVLLCLFLQIRV